MVISTLPTQRATVGIIQLGSGLIGTAISALLKVNVTQELSHKVDWQQPMITCEWLQDQAATLSQYDSIEIIWAAGKAGFGATAAEVDEEKANFKLLIETLAQTTQNIPTRCWLMSSAGGLHEGQTCVNRLTKVNPSRPYADLKLYQETLVQASYDRHVICRISSVYTTSNLSGRLGLIPVLMKNGIQHKVSTLVGSESTLRDYVLDMDIAAYIDNHIRAQSAEHGIQYLVNGSPMSIRSVKNSIEQIILKKLYIKYAPVKQNAANITFLKDTKATTFQSSPMLSNIKILYNSLLSYS